MFMESSQEEKIGEKKGKRIGGKEERKELRTRQTLQFTSYYVLY